MVWRFAGPCSIYLAYFLDLLHYPKYTKSSHSLISPIRLGEGVIINLFLKGTKKNHAFVGIVCKGRPPKVPVSLPPLSCPHVVAYHLVDVHI